MTAREVRALIDSYRESFKKCMELEQKLMEVSGGDPLDEESLLQRLDELEQQLSQTVDFMFKDFLTDRESLALSLRAEGKTFERIGRVFGVKRERASQIINQACRKIADHQKKAYWKGEGACIGLVDMSLCSMKLQKND